MQSRRHLLSVLTGGTNRSSKILDCFNPDRGSPAISASLGYHQMHPGRLWQQTPWPFRTSSDGGGGKGGGENDISKVYHARRHVIAVLRFILLRMMILQLRHGFTLQLTLKKRLDEEFRGDEERRRPATNPLPLLLPRAPIRGARGRDPGS